MLSTDRLCPGCMKDNGGELVCSLCGWDSAKNNAPDKLPVKFIIRDRYIVGKTVFSDTESTVYLGFDSIENRPVSIKEYFPAGLAKRNPDKTVFVPREALFAFNEGLIEFMETNKRFIGFPLASLPSTYCVFEENSTAYSICDTVTGITLKSFIARNGGMLKWEQVRPLFLPLIDSLKAINDMGFVHGAVSPDTVIVCRDNKLRLITVSIKAVKETKKPGETRPVVFKPYLNAGYSAAEQYVEGIGTVAAYTDVYGICATLLTTITGIVPPPADERLGGDTLRIPAHFADELPRQVLVSIANGMQVRPAERTADIETLKNELIYGETKENIRKSQRAAKAAAAAAAPEAQKPQQKGSAVKYAAITAIITALLILASGAFVYFKFLRTPEPENTDNKTSEAPVIENKDKVGDIDPDVTVTKTLYPVPDFSGKTYYDIINSTDYKNFTFTLKGKEYNNKVPAGYVCGQSVAAGEQVERKTNIELTVSLGSFEISMPGINGRTEQEAIIELLKAGFRYENILVMDVSDNNLASGVVVSYEFEPELKAKEKPNAEMKIKIFVNRVSDDT
ncbi:MAG: PASTA domain-containing protein [Clostridia bacterium]|nr:PASTA domain-containing protein [Clostridia bacterium]